MSIEALKLLIEECENANATGVAVIDLNAIAKAKEALATPVAAEPLFWYRPCGDGLYEGPVHHNSVGGKMLRDEKPGAWMPLYPGAAPSNHSALPVREPLTWQPIETAPMDGANVLLVNRKGNMATGLWMDSLSGAGWYLRGGSHGPDTFFNHHHGPTHWMPLPEAPGGINKE